MKVYDVTAGNLAFLYSDLLATTPIHTGEWQAMNTTKSKAHATYELEDVTLVIDQLPRDMDGVVRFIDHSWADDHYLERVGGVPLNPAPSHVRWPYAVRGNADHTDAATRFDHTYPERFWPKYAGDNLHRPASQINGWKDPVSDVPVLTTPQHQMSGIRFDYGDLSDVVDLLVRSPLTRQAYLPVWFPEDTGAVQRQRVPCTLGYHFMIRNNRLSCRYYIRSCDVYRHLSNDIYLAGMLTKWVRARFNERSGGEANGVSLNLGGLVMHITSLHAFVADKAKLEARMNDQA